MSTQGTTTLNLDIVKVNLMDIYQLMQLDGLSKRQACEKLGLSWPTVMRWQHDHPELLQELQAHQKEILQANVLQLNTAYQEVVDKLVAMASKVEDLQSLLAIETRLRMMLGDASTASQGESEQQKSAARFLQGIHSVPGVSKITRTTETVEFAEQDEVIDVETVDA